MSSTLNAGREFCRACGWPLGGSRCDACGGDGPPPPLADTPHRFAYEPSLDPRFDRAFEAFHRRDYTRMVSFCLGAEPTWTSRAVTHGEGPAWILTVGDASVFLSIDTGAGLLAIESPLAKLSRRQRVPALRYALEISGSQASPSRVCLRGDLLVLRFAGRLSSVDPAIMSAVVGRSAAHSERLRAELVARFDAEPALASEGRGSLDWEVLGKARVMPRLALPPRSAPAPPWEDNRAPSRPESIPPILAPPFAGASEAGDSIPPILAPSFAGASEAGDGIPAILAPSLASGGPSRKSTGKFPAVLAPGSRPTLGDLQVEAPQRPNFTPSPMQAVSPEAQPLCDLLRQAQALATALSFEDKPGAMLLLVRATVFRAVYAHQEKSPDAVANLYRGAGSALSEIWLSTGGRQSMQIPTAEPALLAMARIVSLNGRVPKEKPVTIDPLTSAAHAKEHLSRYASEIDRAPPDASLRHFLALGALSELLVRAKLLPPTEQRLREIVLYAHREDKKLESIELMMTALRKIVAP